MSQGKRKFRAAFRKNRVDRARSRQWSGQLDADSPQHDDPREERISGKGELTRKRTIVGVEASDESGGVVLQVDQTACLPGRVLSVHGLASSVATEDGRVFQCATRRLLKTLSTDQRHVVAAGDRVLFRPSGAAEGIIERVEPRHGVLSRDSRGRQHVLVANVDQVLIVSSAAEPPLKPNLIDRFIATAHQNQLRPVIAINKIDLVDPASLQPLIGVYSQMGYLVLPLSAATGQGLDRLRRELAGRATVVAGQSGVGKSSLLNAIDPRLKLPVSEVSAETTKGRHTTTTARLWPLASGGYVVDTPGIRQFQLWDMAPAEVAGYFRDLRAYIHRCKLPDCTHRHEPDCAVKDAVADGRLDERRYESYCKLFAGEWE
jgi:ribosome biogenesis GTPase